MSGEKAARCHSSQNLVLVMFLTAITGLSVLPVESEFILETVSRPVDNKTTTTTTSLQFLLPSSSEKRLSSTTTVSSPPAQLTTPPQANDRGTLSRTDSVTNNHWLESILNRVDSLNLNNQHGRTEVGASEKRMPDEIEELDRSSKSGEETVHNNNNNNISANLFISSSEVPTDSGEDPLETSTFQEGVEIVSAVPKITLSRQMTNATQYSIADSIKLASHNSDEDSTESTSAPSLNEQVHQNYPRLNDDDSGHHLIESNNVSAMINLSDSVANQNQINEQEALKELSTTLAPPKQPVSCEQAYTLCALRKVCAPALKSYNDDCQDLINNRTNQCSPKCLKAMIALRSSEEGDDLVKCDCQSNEYCLQSKQRSEACRPQVEEAVDPRTLVSCSTASWICLADQLCSTALEFYYRNCQSLFSQRHCSMRCNNSLSILYRQPKAQKLITCQCDGSEEFPCVRYKTYTERFCLNKPVGSQMEAAITLDDVDSNNAQQVTSSDEESFNMTNDPETSFMFGASMANNKDDFHDQDEYDEDLKSPPESGAAVSEDSLAGFNGIQLLEDNWIPLISGRYFANLHQREKAQQQQQHQQQRLQHSQQQRYHLKHQQQRDQTQLSSQQQPRKYYKNAKQKTNKTNNSQEVRRARYSRILVLASSSSSCSSTTMGDMVFNWSTFIAVVVYLSSHILFTRLLLH